MSEHMESKRFDELKLQGRDIKCPKCDRNFPLMIGDTIGGGWGVVGVKCPHCGTQFGIDGGG